MLWGLCWNGGKTGCTLRERLRRVLLVVFDRWVLGQLLGKGVLQVGLPAHSKHTPHTLNCGSAGLNAGGAVPAAAAAASAASADLVTQFSASMACTARWNCMQGHGV